MSCQKVLLIDDSPAIHNLVRAMLEDEPVELSLALDGAAGAALAASHVPDLVLLDVDMPDVDGFEVCRRLKADPATARVPVLFLSALSDISQKVRGLECGAYDYVTKPFHPAELCARVRAALRNKYFQDQLNRRAMTDGLTGLWNRSYFEQRLTQELSSARRNARPLSCVMADIDHFKSINDTWGHAAGDNVLRGVAQLLVEGCRTEDLVCRYGGEEFAVLLSNTGTRVASELVERLRDAIARRKFAQGGKRIGVTCSFGVAHTTAGATDLVEMADRAMYQAKRAGRNRVVDGLQPAAAWRTP